MAVQGYLSGLSVAPVNGAVLASMVAPYPAQVRRLVARANSAGGSATVLDLLRNGASMYHAAAVKPTIAAGVAGAFPVSVPTDRGVREFDILTLLVLTAGGHGNVVATAALEEP